MTETPLHKVPSRFYLHLKTCCRNELACNTSVFNDRVLALVNRELGEYGTAREVPDTGAAVLISWTTPEHELAFLLRWS